MWHTLFFSKITVAKVSIYLAQKDTKYKNVDISKITLQCPFLMQVLMKILPCFSLKPAFIIFAQLFSTDVGTSFYIEFISFSQLITLTYAYYCYIGS